VQLYKRAFKKVPRVPRVPEVPECWCHVPECMKCVKCLGANVPKVLAALLSHKGGDGIEPFAVWHEAPYALSTYAPTHLMHSRHPHPGTVGTQALKAPSSGPRP